MARLPDAKRMYNPNPVPMSNMHLNEAQEQQETYRSHNYIAIVLVHLKVRDKYDL